MATPPTPEDLFKPKQSFDDEESEACRQNSQLYIDRIQILGQAQDLINGAQDHSMTGKQAWFLIEQLQKLRHDVVHFMVATELGVVGVERSVTETLDRVFGEMKFNIADPLFNKTPDIIKIDNRRKRVLMIDVGVSVSPKVVIGFKEAKYFPVRDKLKMILPDYSVRFHACILDQSLTNLDVMLSPLGMVLTDSKRQGLRIIVSSINNMMNIIQTAKLSRIPTEIEIFHLERTRAMSEDKGYLSSPLPSMNTLKPLEGNEFFEEAKRNFETRFKQDEYATKIVDKYKEIYDYKKLKETASFVYPSPSLIEESFQQMEQTAQNGSFERFDQPKPSINFMLALTTSTQTKHDGDLDLANINRLKWAINNKMYSTTQSRHNEKMFNFLMDLFDLIPELSADTDQDLLNHWLGKETETTSSVIKCRATINYKSLKHHSHFLEDFAGLGKKSEVKLSKVKSLPFWEVSERERAENYIYEESKKLGQKRKDNVMSPKFLKTGITALDTISACQREESNDLFNYIQESQSSHCAKQISEMCFSLLIQKKREANNVQVINKGDLGFTVITLPHRLLETGKIGNSIPYIVICKHKPSEQLIGSEILECQFRLDDGDYLSVSRGMRLDSTRLESLSHSYELFNSVSLGWLMSMNEKPKIHSEDQFYHELALGYLFYLCHSVHLRTGALLDNLRYMFMDVTAEKSNFKLFMMDNGLIALKNTIQVALYSRMRKTLPLYSLSAKSMRNRSPQYDKDLDTMEWGSLGVENITIPSLISSGYKFNSFMSATNEIVGLFFSIPKDLHGAFHKMVKLESTPFEWQEKINRLGKEKCFLDWDKTVKSIENGHAEKQTVDLNMVYEVGRFLETQYLQPRRNELMKKLSELRLHDSILSHKQFTSSHSCIYGHYEEGYIKRDKVLLSVYDLINQKFEGKPPSLWDFCIWAIRNEEPFEFAISPKGQRTKDDREIYIGNLQSFSLRLVEKVFSVVCQFQENEAIHVAGDRKYMSIQTCFRNMLNWSRNLQKTAMEKKQVEEKMFELEKKIKSRQEFENQVRALAGKPLKDWSITQEEHDLMLKVANLQELSEEERAKNKAEMEREAEMAKYREMKELCKSETFEPHVAFLNGDRTKWSAADVCEKFLIFIDALKSIPEQLRLLMKAILIKHDKKRMYLSKRLHEKNLELNIKSNPIREVCGTLPYGVISGNWFQGMLNYTSSSFHSACQEYSWKLLQEQILTSITLKLTGLCHSDDEVAFLGYGLPSAPETLNNLNDLNLNPLDTILSFHTLIGSLCCMNYSLKKTNVHLKVAEFVSFYLIWGDQQFPFMKHLATSIAGLPGTGLDDDMYSALSQVMMAGMRGCPLSTLQPILLLAQKRIDRMYSIGEGMTNDVEKILKIPRQYLPLELGGTFFPGPLALLAAGPSIHDVMIIKLALENRIGDRNLCDRILRCYYALSPHGLIKSVADNDPLSQAEDFASTKLSGFQGMIFKNYLPKKKDDLLESIIKDLKKEDELEFMIRRPTASIIKPTNGQDSMTYWKLIMSKPAWIRSVRKQGARGMAIKRCQWIKGEHVKLRYDDEWMTMKACLTQISRFCDDKLDIGAEGMKILEDYVYNSSSSTSTILDYFSRINVTRSHNLGSQVKKAEYLTKPDVYRDVRNDIRKVISLIWDDESLKRENINVKFPEMITDDIAKIKQFYRPTLERDDPRMVGVVKFYKSIKKLIVRDGLSYCQALKRYEDVIGYTKKMKENLERIIHEVYSESSWVYKQFEDNLKKRVVIMSASSQNLSPMEKIINYNCLRWSSMRVTTGVSLMRNHPTANTDERSRELLYYKPIIDTLCLVYKKLVKWGVKLEFIKKVFHNLGLKGPDNKFMSLMQHLKNCKMHAMNDENVSYSDKKVVAILLAYLRSDMDFVNLLLKDYTMVLSAWPKAQEKIDGKWTGPFEYVCWRQEGVLRVRGTSIGKFSEQIWMLKTNSKLNIRELLFKAIREVINVTPEHSMSILQPQIVRKVNYSEMNVYKSGNDWTIGHPPIGSTYIPRISVEYDPELHGSHLYKPAKTSQNLLDIWQEGRMSKAMTKMFTIRHSRTYSQICDKIELNPMFSGNLVVNGINLNNVIKLNLTTSFMSSPWTAFNMTNLKECMNAVKIKTPWIDEFWRYLEKMTAMKFPRLDDIELSEQEFPKLTESSSDDEDSMPENFDITDLLKLDDEEQFDYAAHMLDELRVMNPNEYERYFSEMSLKQKENYFQLSSLKPESMFVDPTITQGKRVALYTELNGDEETYRFRESSSESSGSSLITIHEFEDNPNRHFLDKIILRTVNFYSTKQPTWPELFVSMIEEVKMGNIIKLSLKEKSNSGKRAMIYIWETFLQEVFVTNPEIDMEILSDSYKRVNFFNDLQMAYRKNRLQFDNWSSKCMGELFKETFVKAEVRTVDFI